MGTDSGLVFFNSSLSAEPSQGSSTNSRQVGRVFNYSSDSPHGNFEEDNIEDVTCVHSSSGVCAPIIDFETVERKQTFTVYRIHVVTLAKNWYIFRRYTDFVRLDDSLQRHFPAFHAKLPPKRWLGNNYDPAFLKQRKRGLQTYINSLMRHDLIARSKPLREFLCLDDPPGPFDSIEESRAYCEEMEQVASRERQRACELESELYAAKSRLAQAQVQQEVLAAALKSERLKNNRISRRRAGGANTNGRSAVAAIKNVADCGLESTESDDPG